MQRWLTDYLSGKDTLAAAATEPVAGRPACPQNWPATDLHAETYGTAAGHDPVLLIHGSGSWGTDTFGGQRALADEFRLIVLDRRGSDLADLPPAPAR